MRKKLRKEWEGKVKVLGGKKGWSSEVGGCRESRRT